MKKLPIDLPLKTQTVKVSVGAWQHAQELKAAVGCRVSDVLSVALLMLDEEKLRAIMTKQEKALAGMSKGMREMLKNMDTLSDEDREILKKMLG